MILKRIDSLGNKTYINAFTGRVFEMGYEDPMKRPSNDNIANQMNGGKFPMFGSNLKEEIANNQRTVFIGDYKRMLRIKPKNRNKREFIIVCKRVNINPWPLIVN